MAQWNPMFIEPQQPAPKVGPYGGLTAETWEEKLGVPFPKLPPYLNLWQQRGLGMGYIPRLQAERPTCEWRECGEPRVNNDIPLCHEHVIRVWGYVEDLEADGVKVVARKKMADVAEIQAAEEEQRQRWAEESRKAGWVYYLRVGELIKIGYTNDIYRRVKQYPPNVKFLAFHPGTLGLEQEYHRNFAQSRAMGREWYHPTEEVMAQVRRAREIPDPDLGLTLDPL